MFANIHWNNLKVLVGIALDQQFMLTLNQHWPPSVGQAGIVLLADFKTPLLHVYQAKQLSLCHGGIWVRRLSIELYSNIAYAMLNICHTTASLYKIRLLF